MAARGSGAGQGNAVLAEQLARIEVVVAATSDQRLLAQHFRSKLEDLLNPGEQLGRQKSYRLNINLGTVVSPGLIAPDGKAQRFTVNLQSSYTLTQTAKSQVIDSGAAQRVGSYNNPPNAYFSTFVAEQDALKRLATALAKDYQMKLAAALVKPVTPAE